MVEVALLMKVKGYGALKYLYKCSACR